MSSELNTMADTARTLSIAANYAPIAERDGLTPDQAYVLVMRWAWPWGIAIRPAFEKAHNNHPHWQAWLAEQRTQPIPTLASWDVFTQGR